MIHVDGFYCPGCGVWQIDPRTNGIGRRAESVATQKFGTMRRADYWHAAHDGQCVVRVAAATLRGTGEDGVVHDEMLALAKDTCLLVLREVAANPEFPISAVRHLATSNDFEIRRALWSRAGLDGAALEVAGPDDVLALLAPEFGAR